MVDDPVVDDPAIEKDGAIAEALSALANATTWLRELHPTRTREQRLRLYQHAFDRLFAVREREIGMRRALELKK